MLFLFFSCISTIQYFFFLYSVYLYVYTDGDGDDGGVANGRGDDGGGDDVGGGGIAASGDGTDIMVVLKVVQLLMVGRGSWRCWWLY